MTLCTAWAHGVSTTPILYCGGPFYPDFVEEEPKDGLPKIVSILKPENYHLADEYFDDVTRPWGMASLLFWTSPRVQLHTPNFNAFYPEEPAFPYRLAIMPEDMDAFLAKQELVWEFIQATLSPMWEKDPVNALGA